MKCAATGPALANACCISAGVMASVQFSLERPTHVVLRIVDANGRFVAEPFGADFAGAKLEVGEGVQHVAGLEAALAARA